MVWVNLDHNIQPEKKQNIRPLKGNEIPQVKPKIGQGRVGMRGRKPPPINQNITPTSELSQKILEVLKISRLHNPSAISKQS